MDIIDSHQHFWRLGRGDYSWLTPDLGSLYRDFAPQDYLLASQTHQPKHTVLVQAATSDAETDYMLKLAQDHKFIAGVVAWVEFSSDSVLERLDDLAQNPYVKGIRPMLQDIEDTNWILNPEYSPIFDKLIDLNLSFDALIQVRHLDVIDQLAGQYPALKFIVDHCAKPDIASGVISGWQKGIEALAKHSNLVVKFSGLPTEANPTQQSVSDYQSYFKIVFEAFGSKRLLWGSDWPVVNINSSYLDWLNICKRLTQSLSAKEQQDFWAGNAKRIYALEKNNA